MSAPVLPLGEEEWLGLEDLLALVREDPRVREAARRAGADPSGLRAAAVQLEEAVRARDLAPWLAAYERRVAELVEEGQDYDAIVAVLVRVLSPLEAAAWAAHAGDPPRAARLQRALGRLYAEMLVAVGRAYARLREEAIEAQHLQAIRELSTPVIQVWEQVLVMPVIGVVDSARARQIMEHLLERIVALRARIVIIDLTGVAAVDTQVAGHLLRTTQAARLVGARSIVVGISPQVAQALVRLGVSLGELETYLDLRSGLQRAFEILGYAVVRAAGGAGAG